VNEAAFDEPRRRLTVGRWSARACSLHAPHHDDCSDGDWSAILEIRRGVNLLVRGQQRAPTVWVELWSGEPDMSDGLAVVVDDEELAGVARIPLCACGERRCGNAGVQLAASIAATDLPALVDTLRAIPDRSDQPQSSHVWRGEFTDSRPVVTT
jgi:hypothetical protein